MKYFLVSYFYDDGDDDLYFADQNYLSMTETCNRIRKESCMPNIDPIVINVRECSKEEYEANKGKQLCNS